MKLAEKYLSNLNMVRVSSSLLNDLKTVQDKNQTAANRLDRLRIATALFHDLNISDYGLVKFLLTQELKAIRHSKFDLHAHYSLKLIGLLLSRYKNPEDIWLFFEAHRLDKRFDLEFSLSSGVNFVFNYLATHSHPLKSELLRRIGRTYETTKYVQSVINRWNEEQESFFEEFCSFEQDEIHFAFMMEEVQVVKQLLPRWIKDQNWTSESLLRYVGYARAVKDPEYEITSLELYIAHEKGNAPASLILDLASLYAVTGQSQKAVENFGKTLSLTSNNKIVNASLRGLCKVILNAADQECGFVKVAYSLIQEHKRNMKDMSESVSKSIDRVTRLRATAEDPKS